MTRILFVCTGNICRSPTAEGVARQVIQNNNLNETIKVDSAGTGSYHVGEPPDPRAQRAARRRGIELADLRARRVAPEDFEAFDLILAMDLENLESLQRACPESQRHKLELFMRYARRYDIKEVPDPYFGGDAGFDLVLDMVEDAAQGLIDSLRR
ncbi:MAG: low molecular weight protein-tyrosine-phosphatase [Gemmatimonadota bacterium]